MNIVASLQEQFFRWALRGRPPEPAPVLLTQRRVYVLPTRQGLGFAVTLLTMLLGAINYNLSLGYALVFLLAGLGIGAILHAFRNLAHLSISPARCVPVFAGTPADFVVRLDNARDAERPAIRVHLPGRPAVNLDVPSAGRAEAHLLLPTTARGWLTLPRVTLSTTWPLGLIRAWAYAAPEQRCLVYPAPAASAGLPPAASGDAGETAIPMPGADDFSGLRDHQPADPPRHVAWKAVARQHDDVLLLTKQFSGNAARSLWFDWDALPEKLDVETRLSLLTRWICDAHASGLTWGLRLPDGPSAPATGDAHYHACLKRLALHGQA